MRTAAQNDQIRATELKIINQPTAAPIGGSCASSVDIVATKRDSGDLYSGRLGLLCGKYDSGSSAAYGRLATWRSLLDLAASGTGEDATAVVDAVLAASPEDELDWIEWKSSLDLSSKTVRGTLARHILGTANRLPERAVAHVGGRGFVVVGAESGGIQAFGTPDRNRVGSQPAVAFPGGAGITAGWMWAMPLTVMG